MKRVPLGEVLELADSGVWGPEDVAEGVSVLRSTNFRNDGTLNLSSIALRSIDPRKRVSKLLLPGDILLEKSGGGPLQPVGRVCRFEGDGQPHAFGNFLARLRPRSSMRSEYLCYFLRHFHRTGQTSSYQKQTTGIRNLEFSRYLTIEVPCPSEHVQSREADKLARAEGILRLRREAQRKAAELIPALFLDRFGDPTSNPKCWPIMPLSGTASVMSGATKGRRIDPADAIDVPYMRVANVKDGYLDLSEIKAISIRRNELCRLSLERGDLLMTEGGDPDKLGRAAIWTGVIAPCVHQNHIFKVRADRSKVLPEYLRSLAGSAYGKAYFLRVAKKTTGIASINKTQLSAFPVLLPPLSEQTAFARDVEAVESIISLHEQAEAKAQAVFDALLQRSFAT